MSFTTRYFAMKTRSEPMTSGLISCQTLTVGPFECWGQQDVRRHCWHEVHVGQGELGEEAVGPIVWCMSTITYDSRNILSFNNRSAAGPPCSSATAPTIANRHDADTDSSPDALRSFAWNN
jgi:hypothetical protein